MNIKTIVKKDSKIFKYCLAASVILFVISFIKMQAIPSIVYDVLLVLSALLSSVQIFAQAIEGFKKSNINETSAMSMAIIFTAILGEFSQAAGIAILFNFSQIFCDIISAGYVKRFSSLSKIKAARANVLTSSNEVKTIAASKVSKGSHIVIYPKERIPLDCIVIKGSSTIDAHSITGDESPIYAQKGSALLSGMVNGNNTLVARATSTIKGSAASKILQTIENSFSTKSKTQQLTSKISYYYIPLILLITLIVALFMPIATGNWGVWIPRSLGVLATSCVYSLTLAAPIGFFSNISAACKKGIIIKSGKSIEDIVRAKCIVFDMDEILTSDTLKVSKVEPLVSLDSKAILLLAAIAECHSSHPIARAIKEAAPPINDALVTKFNEIPKQGVAAKFGSKRILCGNQDFLRSYGVFTNYSEGVLVALDGELVGIITVKAQADIEIEKTIKELRLDNLSHIVMFTSGSEESAKTVAKEVDIDEYYSNLTAKGKAECIKQLREEHGKVVYVGDVIKDAEALRAADVGVCMGVDSTLSQETADMILTNGSLSKLVDARRLSKRAMMTISANIIFVLAAKLMIILLAVFGFAPVWLAAFFDIAVNLLSVIISSFTSFKDVKVLLPFKK